MKNLKFNLLVILTVLTSNIFAQEFYPLNLLSFITDENINENALIKVNDYQLYEKGFIWENDSLYKNAKTSEIVKITAKGTENFVQISVNYYTIASDLTRLVDRANKAGLDKISENVFEKTFDKISYRFEIRKNISLNGKKYNLLSFVFKDSSTKKNAEKRPIYFRTDHSYPLQNTVWYFDCDIRDDKNSEGEYYINMKFATDKKYAHKIEFLDDANFKVTLASKKIITGTYVNGGYGNNQTPTLNFELFKPTAKKDNVEIIGITGIPRYSSEIKLAKGTLPYYQYFFTNGYTYKFEQNNLMLTGKIYENMPTTAPPTSTKKN